NTCDALPSFSLESSKHLRSRLLLLFRQLLNRPVTDITLKLAAVLELTHNTSLVFDDLIDYSEGRMNERVGYKEDNKGQVLRTGLMLYSGIYRVLCSLNDIKWVDRFSKVIHEMSVGEVSRGVFCAAGERPSIEKYTEAIRGTTGSLFALSARMAAHEDDDNENSAVKLYEFGNCLGLAYQICDDLNDMAEDFRNELWTLPFIFSADDGKTIYSGNGKLPMIEVLSSGAISKCIKLLTEKLDCCKEIISEFGNPVAATKVLGLCQWMESEARNLSGE
ncbi:MAG: polyprenyl synthetase family protein, partial [Candidatus Theseobacter exili]|nr:polyprenyl synthetase family protein [Candidatus Theseobacter exili]